MDAASSIYAIWRMMPFMLTSFFVISFFLNSNIANLVLFSGILGWSFLVWLFTKFQYIQNMIVGNASSLDKHIDQLKTCNVFFIGNPTIVPLSLTTYSFLLGYFSYILHATKQNISSHIGFIIGFILLIVLTIAELIHASMNCISLYPAIFFALISAVGGFAYAVATKKKDERYWYVPKKITNSSCSLSDNKYTCS